MGRWAQVNKDGDVVDVIDGQPDSWENPDGSWTTSPVDTDTDPAILAKAGWYPITEAEDYDPATHRVTDESLVFVKTKKHVRVDRKIEELPEPPPSPEEEMVRPLVERSDAIEERQAALDEKLARLEQTVEAIPPTAPSYDAASFNVLIATMQQQIVQLTRDVADLKAGKPGGK